MRSGRAGGSGTAWPFNGRRSAAERPDCGNRRYLRAARCNSIDGAKPVIVLLFKAIPHNSKCRYGERGAAAAKPKAQIILCVLSSIFATQMPCRSRRSGA
ncbi:MAG: hypothetical protein WAY39_03445, partial [Gemmiger qucibialis]